MFGDFKIRLCPSGEGFDLQAYFFGQAVKVCSCYDTLGRAMFTHKEDYRLFMHIL